MLVDERMKIDLLNKLLSNIDIGKIFFCLILEKCNYVDIQPKKNSLLKIMDYQRNLATIPNNDFNKSAGSGHNDVKI